MIHIAKPWTKRRRSEPKLANENPLVWIARRYADLVDLECSEEDQAKLKILLVRYTSQGASGAYRVHRWQLGCFSFVLGDTKDWNDVSGQ
jgi:hypothetical protein